MVLDISDIPVMPSEAPRVPTARSPSAAGSGPPAHAHSAPPRAGGWQHPAPHGSLRSPKAKLLLKIPRQARLSDRSQAAPFLPLCAEELLSPFARPRHFPDKEMPAELVGGSSLSDTRATSTCFPPSRLPVTWWLGLGQPPGKDPVTHPASPLLALLLCYSPQYHYSPRYT